MSMDNVEMEKGRLCVFFPERWRRTGKENLRVGALDFSDLCTVN